MATVTTSIDSGGDYATPIEWEADLDNGAVYSSTDLAVGEATDYAEYEGSMTFNGGPTVGLTSARLTVVEADRHDGTAGVGARFVAATTGRTVNLATTSPGTAYTFEWLEWDGAGFTNTLVFTGNDNAVQKTVRNCVCHAIFSTSTVEMFELGATTHFDVLNCFIYDVWCDRTGTTRFAYGIASSGGTGDVQFFYNISMCNVRGTGTTADASGIRQTTSGRTLRNAVVLDTTSEVGTGADFQVTAGSRDYCASSDATAPGGNSITSVDSSLTFVSTVVGSEDLHLISGASVIGIGEDKGTSPSGVQFDINGFDRDTAAVVWDMGADQFEASTITGRLLSSKLLYGGILVGRGRLIC